MKRRLQPAATRPGLPRCGGFTLVELMVTLVISAVLAAIAVPSMRNFIARKRVEGVAQELATDLRYLKSIQVQRNETVAIRFGAVGASSCYVLYTTGPRNNDCDCSAGAPSQCGNGSAELKTVVLQAGSGMSISANPDQLRLAGSNGLPFNGVTLQASVLGARGGEVRVSTNAAMRTDICSVSGHDSALPACH